MEKDFEKYLKVLNSEGCLKKPKAAAMILDKIGECFNQEKSKFRIGLLIGLLLEDTNSIFSFIWKTSAALETVPSTSAAFKLLEHLVINFQSCAEPYFPVLLEKCMYLIDRKLAKVKEVSLRLIRSLIVADSKQLLDLSKLVSELERHCRESTKTPGSVIEQIYGLLGYLFEKYPESVKNKEWFLNNICESLRFDCTVTKNPSIGRIKSAFEGINGYFTNYSSPNAETTKKIYEYIKAISKFRQDKKMAGKVGLKILHNHWSLFSDFIYSDREFWRINLEVWTKQRKEDNLPAFKFLNAFYSVIARFAKRNSDNSEVSSYIQEFVDTLVSECSTHEKKSALVGIKLFILTDVVKEPEVSRVYEVLLSFIQKQESFMNFVYSPLCLETLSAFVLKFSARSVSMEQLLFLQKLSVQLIDTYPMYEPDSQSEILVALEKSFYLLGLSGLQIMESHIGKVVYQGLIKTCSSVTLNELEFLKETEQPHEYTSYKSYLSLWKYLLTMAGSPNLPVNGSFPLKKGVASRVFDVFIESFLKIISKLNLSIDADMKVENPSDLSIFINLVDLYQDLIPLVDPFLLQKWLGEILKVVIYHSCKNPLVSGFYKITAANLKLADSIEFFEDASQEKQRSREMVAKFLEEILPRIDQYKGELQTSCLKMILTAPVKTIEGFLEKTVPALEVAIHLAKSEFPLLKDLIEALDRWDLYLAPAASGAIMEKILPQLDRYFQSTHFSESSFVHTRTDGAGKRKNSAVCSESELLMVQKKFLMFLGQMDSRKAVNMIELQYTGQNSLSDRDLIYRLPFTSGSVEINLNDIMPRVMDLATSCIDRGTRVTACELLYSGVMILLGNTKELTGGYTVLFREMIRTCLVLGCDSDGVISQIFEPLMYQIVRYYSGKEALNLLESNYVIDVLMDYVTRPYNPTLRDFSAHLIKEFTVWAIKQLTPEELRLTRRSVSRILRKIYALTLHPSFNKRLGAAVAFNSIYSVLREEEFILNAYWFQLYYYFMESLRMCEEPEDVTEILEAIHHVKRPLVEKCAEFNEDCPERFIPPEFEGGRLCHLVKWTMERSCDIKAFTRRTAMALVRELAPLVENCDETMSFVSKQFQNFFVMQGNPFRSDSNDENFTVWLKYQIAAFEYCTWLLEEDVVSTEIFEPRFVEVLKSYIAGILSQRDNAIAVEVLQQQSVLAFLKLVYRLKDRAYLFPPELWEFLRVALFSPSQLGFRPHQTGLESLSTRLTELLTFLFTHLPLYEWDYFYKDLETIVRVPAFSRITKNQEVDVRSWEFLFAFDIIETSGFWITFRDRMHFPADENLFVSPIFRSLFVARGRTVYAVALEPGCRFYLKEVLEVFLRMCDGGLKGVLDCLENGEEVVEEETGKSVEKGVYFQFLFKNTLTKFLGRKPDLIIEKLLAKPTVRRLTLLLQTVENLSENADLANAVFQSWSDVAGLTMKDTVLKNKLLLQLAIACAKVIGTPGFLKNSPVSEKIYEYLENQKFEDVDAAEGVLSLLPFLSDFAEVDNDRLHACLLKFDVDQGRLEDPSDRDGLEFRNIKLVIKGVLQSFKVTASLVLFRFALSRATWFGNLCSTEDIDSALKAFAEISPLPHSINALQLAYRYCFEKEKTPFVAVIYKLFLNPLMNLLPNAAVYQLVDENLMNLCEVMSTSWEEEKNLAKIKAIFIRTMCAAEFFQTFVTKLTKRELDEMPRERRQLIDTLVKRMFFLLKHPYPPKPLQERYRKLMCEIFNMICSIIRARCKEEKFYKLFIFDERGSFLFAAVDATPAYNFGMDFDELLKRKKLITLLQEAVAVQSQVRSVPNPVNYIQTNTLFTSSLREDVTRFDLTCAPVRPMESLPRETTPHVEVELEMDSLNRHECMPNLIATITKMVRDKITPCDDVTNLPCWLKFFLGILTSSRFCENLKLFVLKAIYNVQSFVAPYCETVFPGMLDAMLGIFRNRPLNYFLIDLIEMMISWAYLPGEEKSRWQLTELVVLVIVNIDSFRRDIVRNNLQVLKVMVETWKSVLYLPELSSLAFKQLNASVEQDLKANSNGDGPTYANAHICAILLSNGIPAWQNGGEDRFFDLILRNFRVENRHIELFGEMCGLALALVAKSNPGKFEGLEQGVRREIFSLPVCWLQVLYGVHKHYPQMSSFFTYKIFSSVWDATDSLVVRKLEMLLSHVSRGQMAEDPTFEQHAYRFFTDLCNSPDAAVQELSLRIADRLLDKFDDDQLMGVLKEAVRLQKSVHLDIRKWAYEIAMKLYEKGNDLRRICSVILLRGLNDGAKDLEDTCLEFWRKVLDLSSLEKTILEVLKVMYTPETEKIFLSNSAKILLQFATDSGQLEKPIFIHPITHQCRFQKRNLVLRSRQSIFRSTLSRSLANESVEVVATLKHQNLPYLRPTASNLAFEPTAVQSGGEEAAAQQESSREDIQVASNPFKRRFYKSDMKTSMDYANWQKRRKKKEMEEEEKAAREREIKVDIYGEYRDGDFPDIQIHHSQILKLFEVLVKKDEHFARQFLVSLYSGLIGMVKTHDRTGLLWQLGKCFEEMLKSSESFDPGVFGFVLQLVVKNPRNMGVDCQLISNAAASTNWLSLGALIIEGTIANTEDFESSSPKRRRGTGTPEEVRWLELAKLYRRLEEFDVLAGIFQDKLNVQPEAREAIRSETLMRWQEASKRYESVLRAEPNSSHNEFYSEAYFSCLARLSNWSALNKCVKSVVQDNMEELWKNYNLLSWYIKSELMISLASDCEGLPETLEGFCKHPGKKNVLVRNFGEELAAFDLLANKFQRAHYRIDRLCLDFLAGWSHLDRWSYNLRAAKLTGLQTLSELSLAIVNLAEVRKTEQERNVKAGVMRWDKNLPTSSDDLTVWDVKLRYRGQFIKRLKDMDLTRIEIRAYLALARAALQQDNLYLAKEYLSKSKEQLPDGDAALLAQHESCFDLGKIIVARRKIKDDANVGLETYLNVFQDIFARYSTAMETDVDMSHVHSCNFTLGQLTSEMLSCVKKQNVSQASLEAVLHTLGAPKGADAASALHRKGLEFLETARAALDGTDCSPATKSNAYLELSKFLLKFSSFTAVEEVEKLFLYTLKAMELGSSEARQLFGCLLSVSCRTSDAPGKYIVHHCDRVPSWMFLMWTNQILACLNSHVFPILQSILLRIAEDYPNAVRYPLKLAEERDTWDSKTKALLTRLKRMLSKDQLYEDFWNAMKFLASPELILTYHLEKILQEASQGPPDFSRIEKAVSELTEIMFSENLNKFRGPVFKVWNALQEPVRDLSTGFEQTEVFVRKLRNLLSAAENLKTTSRKGLESYSPWLYGFHSLMWDSPLELPGQYDGNRQPVKKYLVTVNSFKNSIRMFSSKCKPMRITVLGNDATERKFLVKFGEDLRQDERIQQVLRHFRHGFAESKQTKAFSLETYKVIPLTHSLGMIEWVEDTLSLFEMLETSLENGKEAFAKAQNDHLAFLSLGSPLAGSLKGSVAAHLTAFEKITRDATITHFRRRVQGFPRNLLRKAFLSLSTSPEHFAHLRKNFATSHAVMCVTHWLLGIGDRHLQNILVSTRTGRAVGIDFGYAFGFATQFLTPPELVPFRFSPQIVALLHPLDESGWIKETMVHSLRLFRKDSFKLLSVLEVFAQEPLMDWLMQARKSQLCRSESVDSWYPREKLSLVERKLNGANPVAVIEADLKAGHSQSKYLAHYLEVLKGVEQDNFRARCGEADLTEVEQVECLLDLATDAHVLGKTYVGWNAWL